MRERSTIVRFFGNLRAAIIPALLFMLVASGAWGAPTVTTVDPPEGSNPPVTTTLSATFGESMDPATITNGSFTVSKSVKIKAIAAGGVGRSVVLKSDGTVAAWGVDATVPPGLSGITAVAAGYSHTLALKNDGTVVSWDVKNVGSISQSGVVAIAAGYSYSLALKNDGTVVAWGNNDKGQSTVPPGLSGVVAISAGYSHSLVLKNDGTVVAWGNNDNGRSTVPPGLSGVVAIAAGGNHSLALKNDGTVVAWGNNNSGQSTVPPGLSGVVAIAAGSNHSLVLKNDGTVAAWGEDSGGGCMSAVPSGLTGVAAIAAGNYQLSLALKNDGTVVAWGSGVCAPTGLSGVVSIAAGGNPMALKNDGTVVQWGYYQAPVGLSGVVAIAAGYYHSMALKSDGTVVAWGGNYRGQTTVPPGLYGVVAIAAGENHSVALKSDGTVVVWGSSQFGQTAVPPGLSGVVAIDAKSDYTLALKNDGTVVAWGRNRLGQVVTVPPTLSGVSAMFAGFWSPAILKNDGTLVTWSGSKVVAVPPILSKAVALSMDYQHSLVLYGDGTVLEFNGHNSNYTAPLLSPYETVVPGSVVYDQTTNTATFTPTVPLEQGSTYIGRVNTGVRNATGEHLPADVSWTFTAGQQANAAITLANLSQPYDGTPKAVTATTDPAGLDVSITYNGSTIPPTAVGSYTVAATVNTAGYAGNAIAVLTITNPIYTIGVSVVDGHGSISCDSPVTMGDVSICTITPDANYHLAAFTDNNEDKLGSVSANSYAINNVTTDHGIVGTFAVNLSANAGPNQTITCSGPTGAQVTLDGSSSTGAATYTWSGPFGTATGVNPTVTIPWGTNAVTLTVNDETGKTISSSVVISVTDNVPPLVNAVYNGTRGSNDWFVSTIDFNLNATDSCSGIREIHYTLDNVEQVVTGTLATFTVSGDGSHTVTYWAVDNAGNAGAPPPAPVPVKISTAAPSVSTSITGGAPSGGSGGTVYYNSCVRVTLQTVVGAAGAITDYSLDNGVTWQPYTEDLQVCASATVTYRSVNEAGLKTFGSITVNIDNTPPNIFASLLPAPGPSGWSIGPVTVNFTCSDNASGIAHCPDPITIKGDVGGEIVTGEAVDIAGNRAIGAATVKIDSVPPTLMGAPLTPPNANGWYNGNVVVHFSAIDALSGIASLTPDTAVTNEGAGQTVIGTAVDMAGNQSAYNVTGINVDRTLPVVTITGVANGATYNLGLVPTASFSVVDGISGVATSNGILTGGDAQGLGQFTYTVTATDKAGNTVITSVTYTVNATTAGTVTLIDQLTATGVIDQQTAETLSNSLATAMQFYTSGNSTAGDNKVGAFINQINAPGRNIPSDIATQLINAANYVISHN